MTGLEDFDNQQSVYRSSRTHVLRAVRRSDQLPVILKTTTDPDPALPQRRALEREFQLLSSLSDARYVVRAHDLITADRRVVLVLEDIGGQSVSQHLAGARPSLPEALSMAIDALKGLQELHERDLIHKDVNPSNLVVNPDTSVLKVIDLDVATRLRHTSGLQAPELLEGTFPYMSPEQTGRMNRPVDHRSDFYSLGVTLYQWLTGSLPFAADDPIGWVHQHIAHTPRPPSELVDLPPILDAIVGRLLAKSAEDRYQSARGVLHDLSRVLDDGGPFEIGSRDAREHFQLSHTVHGRDDELERLLEGFGRASSGQRVICAIRGPAGIGKTSLVNELVRPLTRRRGFFLRGKFDQYDRQQVYGAVVSALEQWLMVVLASEASIVQRWAHRLQDELGDRLRLLVPLLPELDQLCGDVPGPEPLSGEAARVRLQLALDRLVASIAQPDRPLVLVLDDVQWADPATLELIDMMMQDPVPRAMLLVLSYRDDEATSALTWLRAHAGRAVLDDIALGPLTPADLERWLTELVPSARRSIADLAGWVHRKTEGNPFFVQRFLQSLHEAGHLRFDPEARGWTWDLDALQQASITDNVVDFTIARVASLPEATRTALSTAAAMGFQCPLALLSVATRQPTSALVEALWPAIRAGLVQPVGPMRAWEDLASGSADRDESDPLTFEFVHDRVQQACYLRIPEEARPHLHLEMALRLADEPDALRDRSVYRLAHHLRQARSALVEPAHRELAGRAFVAAGHRAQDGAAFVDALDHFRQAIEALPGDGWSEDPDLMGEAYAGALDCAYAIGDSDAVLGLAAEMSPHLPAGPRRWSMYRLQVLTLSAGQRIEEALEIGRRGLRELGVEVPAGISQLRLGWEIWTASRAVRRLSSARGASLRAMTDPAAIGRHELQSALLSTLYRGSTDLSGLLTCTAVRTLSRHGVSAHRDIYQAFLGVIQAGMLGDVRTALELSDLIEELPGEVRNGTRSAYLVATLLDHWRHPLPEVLDRLLRIYRRNIEAGDLLYGTYSLTTWASLTFAWAEDLSVVDEALQLMDAFTRRFGGAGRHAYVSGYADEVRFRHRALCRAPDDPAATLTPDWISDDPQYDVVPDDTIMRHAVHFARAQLYLIFGHLEAMGEPLAAMSAHPFDGVGFYSHWMTHHFMVPLVALRTSTTAGARRRAARRATRSLRTLRRLGEAAAASAQVFVAEWHVLEAERLRALDRAAEALVHYGRAIDSASEVRKPGMRGLAAELAASTCAALGQESLRVHYLQEAVHSYLRWGAEAKVAQLRARHPEVLRTRLVLPSASSTTATASWGSTSALLDPISALKTSQALSEELALEPLLAKLMSAVVENAGAQRGVLFLTGPDGDSLQVAARHTLDGDRGDPDDAPHAIARLVLRTGRTVAIDDARTSGDPLLADPWFERHQPRCVLAIPLEHRGERLGVLHLEHGETPGAFSDSNRAFLRLLAGQFGISLTNARLYADLGQARANAEAARELAEQASEAKSFFLAKMSHELRTPLNAILGYSEIVAEELQDADIDLVDDDLSRIRVAGEALSELIGNILDLTRIETGRVELAPSRFDAVGLFGELADTLRPRLRGANALEVDWAGPNVEVEADRTKLRQILMNLLVNANRYTEDGAIVLRGEIVDDLLAVDVIDTGIGIPDEHQQAIFEPFTQVDNTFTRARDGAGLGLAICRQLCEAMGGSLTLQSRPGEGSCFSVRLPVVRAAAPAGRV